MKRAAPGIAARAGSIIAVAKGGEGMARDVMCTVENCKFWDNRHCKADAVEVNVDGGGNKAGYTAETNCHTFVNRDKM
jgi:hypothetical protein